MNNKKLLLLALIAAAVAAPMQAQTFDYTDYSTTLTAGLVVVASTAAGIAAIMAGVMVWKKIAKYFNRAG